MHRHQLQYLRLITEDDGQRYIKCLWIVPHTQERLALEARITDESTVSWKSWGYQPEVDQFGSFITWLLDGKGILLLATLRMEGILDG